jgi:hypothetical protein
MKKLLIIILLLPFRLLAQTAIQDKAVTHQEQRMVFNNWDQNKFDPKGGFLTLNPYYWLVWGLFYPNYHKTDLRPLGPNGPQTSRLGLAGVQSTEDDHYKLHSDTVKTTALLQIAAQSGLLSDADPLWLLYYKNQFSPLLNYSAASILGPLPPAVSHQLLKDGLYNWYTGELSSLKERLNGSRTTNQDRGSRILSYYRLLKEYQNLTGIWAIRTASAQKLIAMTLQQQQVQQGKVTLPHWTPQTDEGIAQKVLLNRKY